MISSWFNIIVFLLNAHFFCLNKSVVTPDPTTSPTDPTPSPTPLPTELTTPLPTPSWYSLCSDADFSAFGVVGIDCSAENVYVEWSDAQAYCEDKHGTDLVTISDSIVNYVASNSIGNKAGWIGLNDINNEGTFTWEDGSNSGWRNWASGQPNDGNGDEDCGMIKSNQKWNDRRCSNPLSRFVCNS